VEFAAMQSEHNIVEPPKAPPRTGERVFGYQTPPRMKEKVPRFLISRLFAASLLVFFACGRGADTAGPVVEADIAQDDPPAVSSVDASVVVPAAVQPENTAEDAAEKTAVPATAVRERWPPPQGGRSGSQAGGSGGRSAFPSLSGITARPMGVFIGELDPVNYDTVDPAILLQMGLEQDHVAFIMGERYFKAGNYDQALAEYNAAIALNGNLPAALFSRGRIYHEKGDLDRTIADYTGAIRLKSDSVVVYNYRGYAYAQKGDHARAIEDYSRAIALKKDYGDAWFNRGFSYWEKGDYDKAIADFTKLIELEPKNAAVYNQRGIAWYSRGDDRKAVEDFSEAIRLNQNYPLAWHNRAVVWRALGDEARAEKDFAEAARLGYR
jgi:Tfp pilus assembly protein PilF